MSKKPVRGLSLDMLQARPSATTAEVIPPVPLALAQEPAAAPAATPAPPPVPSSTVATTAAMVPRPSTQTVKVPEVDFIRLKTLSARTRRKHQDIILTALREYLDRHGA
jgi:hypothetical protein